MARNLALFGTVALGEAIGKPHLPQVTRYRLRMPGLREPVRLLQLTDFHRSWCVSEWYIAECVRMANRLNPDVIALTGDFVTRRSDYAISCAALLKELRAPLGLYGTLGNHDHWCDNHTGANVVTEIMAAGANVQMLTNRNIRFDNGLRLVGVDDQWTGFPDWQTAFKGVAPTEPTIALTHNPNLFMMIPHLPCVLLAGHTHGGQVNVPILLNKVFGKFPYLKGWFTGAKGVNKMYVSRGLGVVGVPFRINAPPEMTLFYLEPG